MDKKQHISTIESIQNAVAQQCNRYKSNIKNNVNPTSREIKSRLALSPDVRQILATATDRLNLSTRIT